MFSLHSHFDTKHACDRQTDRRTDGQTRTELAWHIRAIAYMLSRVKSIKHLYSSLSALICVLYMCSHYLCYLAKLAAIKYLPTPDTLTSLPYR